MSESGGLPPLPDTSAFEALDRLDEASLDALDAAWAEAERAVLAAMAPYERQLREARARRAQVATERRRRERAARHAARQAVRQAATTGALPTLVEAVERTPPLVADETPLSALRFHLTTGGEVALGYPTKPGILVLTDGRTVVQARTFGEVRQWWMKGWEFGAPGVPGVRVHLVGTRVERVVPPDEVLVTVP